MLAFGVLSEDIGLGLCVYGCGVGVAGLTFRFGLRLSSKPFEVSVRKQNQAFPRSRANQHALS